ncbi:MAG: sulfotransferase family protein [Spongiibacteraceae bacterium]
MAISPTFALFVGPTKSGTTWIHAYLESRGDVALPSRMKETFFFDKVYERGWDWYENLFPGSEDTRLRVEVAPSLFHKPVACSRALKHVPEAKIICTVRDPFDRAVSHFFHYRKRGAPAMSLAEMANTYPDVIEAGLYNKYAARWEEAFGKSNVHFMSYRQLRDDPEGFCRHLCEILELDYIAPDTSLTNTQVNAAKVPRNLIAARAVQGISTFLRRNGAHRVINGLKRFPIKKWLYAGGEKLQSERSDIRKQSASFSETLSKDWESFEKLGDISRL